MAEQGEGAGATIDWTPEAGERLDHLIAQLGGTAAAAKIAERSDEALSRYRRGESRWDCWAVARLCSAAGRPLDWLVFGTTGAEAGRLSEAAVERSAEFVIRAAREFPELTPEDIARSIIRRARDLEASESSLTDHAESGEQYTSR